MRIDAVVVLMKDCTSGIVHGERLEMLSHFNKDEEIHAIEGLGISTESFEGILGYMTDQMIKFIDHDIDVLTYFIAELLESDSYSPDHYKYRFQGMDILVFERSKLPLTTSQEEVAKIVQIKNNPLITSIAYRKIIDEFASDFYNQYAKDFMLSMLKAGMTIDKYLKDIDFAERVSDAFDSMYHELAIAIGFSVESVHSSQTQREVKSRFRKDTESQVRKTLPKHTF